MNICIIGWYGTETIGDRAILAGLLSVFADILDNFSITIGSLFTNFTERTILEDESFYREISENKISTISIFDSLNQKALKKNIKRSDLLIIGGGPLMDIIQMHMLVYAFQYAKKKKIKTAVLGSGWGPLNNQEFRSAALSILQKSDLTVFRDSTSLDECNKHITNIDIKHPLLSSIDPAFFCAYYFKKKHPPKDGKYIAVNFRDVSLDQYGGHEEENEKLFIDILENLSNLSLPIHLIPMHSFHIGGDDRSLLNRLYFKAKNNDIIVHNNPPTLVEVMDLYMNADICVGMRFHSIVLQTILNGKNFILDYTDPQTGKIISMMREIGMDKIYRNRYFSLINKDGNMSWNIPNAFHFDDKFIENKKKVFTENITKLLDNE